MLQHGPVESHGVRGSIDSSVRYILGRREREVEQPSALPQTGPNPIAAGIIHTQ